MSDSDQRARALDQLLEITVLLTEDMTASLARDGLTPSRAPVVWRLGQAGPQTLGALAEASGVSARTMTGLVDGLVATGFVRREPHPRDRRAILVTLTDQGAATVAKLQREQREFAELLFGDLPDERFAGFVSGLSVVLSKIKEAMA